MNRHIAAISATLLALIFAPAAFAQSHTQPACHGSRLDCAQQQPAANTKAAHPNAAHPKTAARPAPQENRPRQATVRASAPRVGDSGRSGQPIERARNSRFDAPPRGQEYRVVDEHLVLVDSNSKQIVTVLGRLGNLLK
ncbi:hypothetical protein FNJ84_01490 [Paracoccus sp. M683]|uniref:hypothetical protein n=1 Tax=Paracoccus sp. M683 TaxID=2594268 RepID=UPI00117BE97A|nr:hypothetical protein [Paracoccus sp. M683]TRW99375.1 hypothetical protein FNJ84_01490 [Paracoccus sp. M683]